MSFPYGQKHRIELIWTDASYSSKSTLTRAKYRTKPANKRMCAKQILVWLMEKDFITKSELVDFALHVELGKHRPIEPKLELES